MKPFRQQTVLLAVAAGTSLSLLIPRPSLAATRQVDDDRRQARNAQFTSIQAAVTASGPGDTIQVFPGFYPEAVFIPSTKAGLKIRGSLFPNDARARPPFAPADPNRDAIVDPPNAPGFNVQADRVTIDSFVVQGAENNPGILTSPDFSGYQIQNNLLRANTIGLYPNTNGDLDSDFERNFFVANNLPGPASGVGIYTDFGIGNADIRDNVFTAQALASMVFAAGTGAAPPAPQEDLDISRNLIVDDNSIVLFNVTDSDVTRNVILRPKGDGVFIGGGVDGVLIGRNVVQGSGFDGVFVQNDPTLPDPNTNIVISRNQLTGNALNGVELVGDAVHGGVTGITVERNETSGNAQDGIFLDNADGNLIRRNQSERNGRDGIRLSAESTGNLVTRNKMKGNTEHDCHDDSVGTGTAGTANLWIKNRGNTENRPGLCRPNEHGPDDNDGQDDHDHDHDQGHGHGHGHGNDD